MTDDLFTSQTSSHVYRSHWSGLTPDLIDAARDGINEACVDCGREPLAGGLRCDRCFLAICEQTRVQRSKNLRRGAQCGTWTGYARHKREQTDPCTPCRQAARRKWADDKRRQAVA